MKGLRERYEERGFTFTVHPGKSSPPELLGSYVPDAVAQTPGRSIAIEVKRRSSPDTERALRDIRRLFDGRSDWQFQVVFMGRVDMRDVWRRGGPEGGIAAHSRIRNP